MLNRVTYVAYVRTPTFIGVRMTLDMHMLTCTLVFFPMIFQSLQNLVRFFILYCL